MRNNSRLNQQRDKNDGNSSKDGSKDKNAYPGILGRVCKLKHKLAVRWSNKEIYEKLKIFKDANNKLVKKKMEKLVEAINNSS
jgi:hypothetical protein